MPDLMSMGGDRKEEPSPSPDADVSSSNSGTDDSSRSVEGAKARLVPVPRASSTFMRILQYSCGPCCMSAYARVSWDASRVTWHASFRGVGIDL
jgi:hypothetical protein